MRRLTRIATLKNIAPFLAALAVCLISFYGREVNSLFFSDIFFFASLAYLITGGGQLVINMGVFNGAAFGTKTLLRLIISGKVRGARLKDQYLSYISSRKIFSGVFLHLSLCLLFFILSVLTHILIPN